MEYVFLAITLLLLGLVTYSLFFLNDTNSEDRDGYDWDNFDGEY